MTTLFGSTVVTPIAPKKKRTLTPLLIVVFLASYGLMTTLIVEQNTTIQAQHNLIQVLLVDSKELWAMKGKAVGDKAAQARMQAQGSVAQAPTTQAPMTQGQSPSVQAPSSQTQTPSTSTPSTQATPQHRTQSRAGKTAKPKTQLPPMPASDLSDQRRALITI